jgi:hypothetical protein
MNRYEEKQEARRARLEARAARLRQAGNARVKRGDDALALIPFGQPILVGHHSEGRDRNYRARARGNIEKGIGLLKAAGDAEARAASVGSAGVSSDDPEAVMKLREKLADLEAGQARMSAANKLIRKHKADPEAGADAIASAGLGISRAAARELFKPDFAGRIGFADFQLSNNGANIRRIKQRIAHLSKAAEREPSETVHASGVRIVENVEENRLQLFFPGKPEAATRAALKSAGFRWAPSEGAWQRQLGTNARWAAEHILGTLV